MSSVRERVRRPPVYSELLHPLTRLRLLGEILDWPGRLTVDLFRVQ